MLEIVLTCTFCYVTLALTCTFCYATLALTCACLTLLNVRNCVQQCKRSGVAGDNSVEQCKFLDDSLPVNASWYTRELLHSQWKHISCTSDCQYLCMIQREKEREKVGRRPVKYHGKWPFKRVFVFQEPLSAVFSALNLLAHLFGWLSFYSLIHHKLPLRPETKTPYYEYSGLWHIYALLAINAWFWSTIFHTRDFDLTEKLDYSSAVALLGYQFILAPLRIFSVKSEAARVMFAAPILAFVMTHILYLNFYQMDYGWNMIVCVFMGVSQLLMWAIWAGITSHPSRTKLWIAISGCALALLLEIYDFPPFGGYADAHALWHATTIPLTCLWWSFVKNDAEFRTSMLHKKAK